MITPTGYAKIKGELDYLWKTERPKVTQEVSDAAALGDRSENAEYKYGKQRLREIDRRLRFLRKRIDALKVVRPSSYADKTRVAFGAWVTMEDDEGEERRYQIVGTDEWDADVGKISVESPIARALMGKREGDEAEIRRPAGDMWVTVTAIEFLDDDSPAAQ